MVSKKTHKNVFLCNIKALFLKHELLVELNCFSVTDLKDLEEICLYSSEMHGWSEEDQKQLGYTFS